MKKLAIGFVLIIIIIIGFTLLGQLHTEPTSSITEKDPLLPTRESQIPANATKVTTSTDLNPPTSKSTEYLDPVPVNGFVNTAGAEDSAFIIGNGSILYFFFVPDVKVPIEKQVLDPTVGIYMSKKVNGVWSEPIRVLLQDEEKLAMDGCEFVLNDVMYFCSAREGYNGLHWFKAQFIDGMWCNWENADDFLRTEEFETGELHISSDSSELYFHSGRVGGKGGLDIWVCEFVEGGWSSPVNVEVVNSEFDEGWPALSPDGDELWFSKNYGVWRSKRVDGVWQEPEEMFSPLCGEPSIDIFGNVYFTHHFFEDDIMLEADIYVAMKK